MNRDFLAADRGELAGFGAFCDLARAMQRPWHAAGRSGGQVQEDIMIVHLDALQRSAATFGALALTILIVLASAPTAPVHLV